MLRLHRTCLAILIAFAAGSFGSSQDLKPLFEKSGELAKDDPKDKLLKESPSKLHEFKMELGKAYRIDLTSTDFLPVIRLETPAGKPIVADFRSGENENARLLIKAAQDGNYRLIVTTVPRTKEGPIETGKYRLTVSVPTPFDVLGLRIAELGTASADERDKTLVDLLAHLHLKGKALSLTEGQLALKAGDALENVGASGADWCVKLGKALEPADNDLVKRWSRTLAGVARRLRLVGHPIDVSGPRLDGKKLDWASYRGKVVLVDFWATWCGPCVGEMPHLKKLYDGYHAKGFDIVAISLDDDVDSPTEFMKNRGYPWACIYDKKQPLASEYGVRGIPLGILVGKDGNVISLNARGEELDRLLEQQLGPIPKGK